jgi:hypothetical protein
LIPTYASVVTEDVVITGTYSWYSTYWNTFITVYYHTVEPVIVDWWTPTPVTGVPEWYAQPSVYSPPWVPST